MVSSINHMAIFWKIFFTLYIKLKSPFKIGKSYSNCKQLKKPTKNMIFTRITSCKRPIFIFHTLILTTIQHFLFPLHFPIYKENPSVLELPESIFHTFHLYRQLI